MFDQGGEQADVATDREARWVSVRHHWPLIVLLVGFGAIYARTASYPFVNWDDPLHVYRNAALLRPAQLSWSERWFPRQLGYPMPLTIASYRADLARVDRQPGATLTLAEGRAFHLTNVLLGLVLVVLAWALCWTLLDHAVLPAAVACALFIAHPLLVEPVSWISARKDLLCAVGALAALLAWVTFLRRTRWWYAVLAAVFALLALASKPTAALLVPLGAYLLLAYRPTDRSPALPLRARVMAAIAGLIVISTALFVVGVGWRWNLRVGGVRADLGLGTTLRNALWALGYHLQLVVAPTELRPKYVVVPGAVGVSDAVGLLAAIVIAVVLVRGLRRAGPATVGLAVFACAYLPVSGLIPLRRFIADSYLLLPLLGLCIATGGLLLRVRRYGTSLLQAASFSAAALVVLMLAVISVGQVPLWQASSRLWARTLHYHPDSPQVCRMLGESYNEQGEHQRAIAVYQRCSTRFGLERFANNLAISYLLVGRAADARGLFSWILRRDPHNARARRYLQELEAQR